MRRLFVLILILGCLFACENKKARVLSSEKMQAVMWDILSAEAYAQHYVKKDSLKIPAVEAMQLQNNIFALHKVSKEDFFNSYNYYLSHAELMKMILDSIGAKAERNRINMIRMQHSRPVQTKMSGDSSIKPALKKSAKP